MPRKAPPPGYVFPKEAMAYLQSQGVIGNETMMYRFVKRGLLHRYGPVTRKAGYYKMSELEALVEAERSFYEPEPEQTRKLTFALAEQRDMEGIAAVARATIGGRGMSAEERWRLVSACPVGNYVVRDGSRVVAYLSMQPLKHESLMNFVNGKVRGWDLREEDFTGWTPGGEPIEVLVMGVAAIGERVIRERYTQRLLAGVGHELERLGSQGVNLARLYSTSESETGIAISLHAGMRVYDVLRTRTESKKRYAFVLDVEQSDLPLLRAYKRAYTEWQREQAKAPAS
jgi:hypothetical protein